MTTELTIKLRKASKAVFLATEESVAEDLSNILISAANKIDLLYKIIAENSE